MANLENISDTSHTCLLLYLEKKVKTKKNQHKSFFIYMHNKTYNYTSTILNNQHDSLYGLRLPHFVHLSLAFYFYFDFDVDSTPLQPKNVYQDFCCDFSRGVQLNKVKLFGLVNVLIFLHLILHTLDLLLLLTNLENWKHKKINFKTYIALCGE